MSESDHGRDEPSGERGRWPFARRQQPVEDGAGDRDREIARLDGEVAALRSYHIQSEKLLSKLFARMGEIERRLDEAGLPPGPPTPAIADPASQSSARSATPVKRSSANPGEPSPSEGFRAQLEELDQVLEAIEVATTALHEGHQLPLQQRDPSGSERPNEEDATANEEDAGVPE